MVIYTLRAHFLLTKSLILESTASLNPYNPAAIWGNCIQFVEGVKDEENISRARAQKGVKGNNMDLLCSLFFQQNHLILRSFDQ